jgi:threonine/homoserine/homoserine lactone efflux protein
MAGLLLVGTVALAVANRTELYGGGDGSPAARWIKGVLGLILMVLGVRQWLGRPRAGEVSEPPSWMAALGTFTPTRSAGLGLLMSAVKPKNPLLTIAAAAAIAEAGLPVGQEAAILLAFTLVASVAVIGPVGVLLTMGERASRVLHRWQVWLSRNNDVVMSIVLLVFGLILVAMGLRG